jgi:hypothetical protein
MLSKSDLQSLRQCRRKLWLDHHQPELVPADDSTTYRRAVDGNIVGEKAREQLGPGCIVPPGDQNKALAADRAKALLAASPGQAAAEVPMVFGGLYARADALVPDGRARVLRETKASTFPLKADKVTPASPKEHHLEDVAIQLWVMEKSGFECSRVELNLLNNQWRYPGNDNYAGLFRQLEVTQEARGLFASIPDWVAEAEAVLAGKKPELTTGKHCSDPYPCSYAHHCSQLDPPGPEHPIELLPDSAGKGLARKLREGKGYTTLLEPKPDELVGKDAALYRRIQQAHRTGKAILERDAANIIDALPYPRFYFDFEGIDFPVPRWAGFRPYEHAPFQWSCHIERQAGVFEHAEFLDLSGNDPSVPCIEAMRAVLGNKGPIIVYHATYERGRLQDLALRHPAHAVLMDGYVQRLFDLLPVVKQNFYDPRMEGSFSIKAVLPVVAPELDYGELEEVQEGTGAQVAYLYATLDPDTTPQRRTELEHGLRIYCRQDTWAMVELAHYLARRQRPNRSTEG